ncbi:MAG: hypothetical protein M1819_003003 [Sarea resinae]|nr:MAG: hypothetical protein M1819_003003 [Sarea resinae]
MFISSLFRQPSYSSYLPRYEHELPLLKPSQQHRTSLPTSPSRGLSKSLAVPTPAAVMMSQSYSSHQDPLLALERKEKQLQQDLQTLLDAQGEGLMVGLAGGPSGDSTRSTSTSPSSRHRSSSRTTTPVRQPVQGRISLRAARRGILDAMNELAAVKDEESHHYDETHALRQEVLAQVAGWERKKDGLQHEIEDIETGTEGKRVQSLKQESHSVRLEIRELENRLAEMRARDRALTGQIAELENSVQSKLSSYESSLSILDSQVQSFLARPPIQPLPHHKKSTFLSLHPARRTLELAKDHWKAEQDFLTTKRAEAETERGALEDGAAVWNEVATEVTAFEKSLRDEMRRMGSSKSRDQNNSQAGQPGEDGIHSLVRQMDAIIPRIESKLDLAADKEWNLLVCCIGAELEAFREGRDILVNALKTSTGSASVDDGTHSDGSTPRGAQERESDGLKLVEDHVDDDTGDAPPSEFHQSHSQGDKSEYEDDDEPDPELLISHQDTGDGDAEPHF